ncbi:GTPase domain-containing protein [Thiobacillus denitrificans]|uniref:GTPase domain-containing protein n=1 Tax=Thiobacillus denitrificans TaxID=36861 RepID=UPI00036E6953|nr:GTPase domain-containing protein [Thiobacillus denitrificans]
MTAPAINLSLIAHTNVGKTTLARTLLGSDVGEVRDEAHTTYEATSYRLVETDEGDSLLLWDTPGFGNSARLLNRLKQHGNPIGWFLSAVWDRYTDRAFWLTQVAVRNVRDEADVILYLVNASELPEDAGYLAPELAVLEWIGKPVIVLLNQTGKPRPSEEELEDETRWRNAVKQWTVIRDVLPLDAFARCWVQELSLFSAIAKVLPAETVPSFERLTRRWEARRERQFSEAMEALAQPIARAACDNAPMPETSMLSHLGKFVGVPQKEDKKAAAAAVRDMGERLKKDLLESAERLIAIHDLKGHAAQELRSRLEDVSATQAPIDEHKAAGIFGLVSGALSGLGADLMSGGLSLGGGMLVGAVLGALGGAGVAKGVNVVRGAKAPVLRWDEAFLDALVISALMRYLAVAHFGRGRGEWREGEYPAFWLEIVTQSVSNRKMHLARIWKHRDAACSSEEIGAELKPVLEAIARVLLRRLHPRSRDA